MPSLKHISATVTNEYLRMLMAETLINEMGGDASVADINRANEIRAKTNMADEAIRAKMQFFRKVGHREMDGIDPDADCRG